jgi:hypothetical protein
MREKTNCLQCGKEIQQVRLCGCKQKYCSQECETKYKWRLKHPPIPEKAICLHCKKEFKRNNKGGKPQIYCSGKCRSHYWRNKRKK